MSYCPICYAPMRSRERRLNGDDICEYGHVYPSSTAFEKDPLRTVRLLIAEMLDKGFKFHWGRHDSMFRGYFASFTRFGGNCRWEQAGHSKRLPSAVRMAAKIAKGKPVRVPSARDFL